MPLTVIRGGPETYLAAIARINAAQQKVVVIPGVQSSPYYYWTGSPWTKTLTAHNYRKQLLLIGLVRPEDYRDCPSCTTAIPHGT